MFTWENKIAPGNGGGGGGGGASAPCPLSLRPCIYIFLVTVSFHLQNCHKNTGTKIFITKLN